MQSAETVLGVLRERGRRGLPLEELYRQMFNPQLYLLAYGRIYANKGAMTPGVTRETVDGMSMAKIGRIITAMRHERYRFRPVRRTHIPKKNGKTRPLGMPSWPDKLVGEVVRLLLEAYYEPTFSGRSHGFRPGRGCHTALREVANTWTGTTWFVEGDISDCFGSLDHHVMAAILAEKIHDNRFLRLLRNMLTAGYLEDWTWNATLSGVPQGGIASPVLSNIYLHKLDVFVEKTLIPGFTRGRLRARNPEYRAVEHAIAAARRKGDRAEVRSLYRRLHSLPSQDPRDPGYRRLRYCRYADDTLLGFAGPKAEAEEIKRHLAQFLRDELRLELSPDKTLITHARSQRARFLGYQIAVASSATRTRRPSKSDGRNRRSLNGTVVLHVPAAVVKAKSAPYLTRGKPACRNPMINDSDYNIVARFGAEYRGIVQYYLLASDVFRLHRLRWVMETSMLHTLARKHRSTVTKMAARHKAKIQTPHGLRTRFEATAGREGRKPLVAWFGGIPLKRQKDAVLPDYGRRLARLESWAAGGADEHWSAASPWRQLNLPQIRLEPLLKARAEELSPGRIRFGHELVGLEQDSEGVRATIRDHAAGRTYVVACHYLLGADGGRRVARLAGVAYEGLGLVTQTATLHVSADFSPWAKDPDVLIRWIFSPQAGVMVVMVPMGPDRWGPESEEWVIHLNYPAGDPRAQSDAQVEADARQALGLLDAPMKIHKITRWSVDAVLASAFRAGRVFLLGDAAHRHPPTGGLGLTSAIHDAQNLCWKLALVLRGHASPALLDTYEDERRPVDERNCQRSLENAVNHFAIGAALGVSPDSTPEQNMAQLRRIWSGRAEDAGNRSAVLRAMRAQSMEFSEMNVEYGYCYQSAAVVPDGSIAPEPADDIRVYQPGTRPGAPLPHAWIDDEDGHRRPIKDLVAPGRFLLIAGEDGQAWCEAIGQLAAETDLPVDALRIGHLDGDLYDPRCTWLRHRQIDRDGAILVRPDRFIAWRQQTGTSDHHAALAAALSQILATPVSMCGVQA